MYQTHTYIMMQRTTYNLTLLFQCLFIVTAMQLTLIEMTNLSYNFCDKFAKLQNNEIPEIANVKYVQVL